MFQQRRCIILQGEAAWCYEHAEKLLCRFNHEACILVSQTASETFKTIPYAHGRHYLGKECDAVVFDALTSFHVNSLAALVGMIRAGGVLILLLSGKEPESYWLKRFLLIAHNYATQESTCFFLKRQGDECMVLAPPVARPVQQTEDQKQAVKAIIQVAKGHRRRPLVLTSDRGRGKTAALGLAAAALIQQGKKNIIVTAPSMATVDTLFFHAAAHLESVKVNKGLIQSEQAEIRFIAPDRLIDWQQKADLLLVDEAAAIPVSLLKKWVNKFSRIVFSTTLHGYEGTGRGFAVRFQKILTEKMPGWKRHVLDKPVRWSENDLLERFSFDAFLLNAEPVEESLLQAGADTRYQFEVRRGHQLFNDETTLQQVFGLMVLSHYRTQPSDLQMLLDREEMSICIIRMQGQVIASAWLIKEGEIETKLAAEIYAGKRRIKGHFLPQSLLTHCAIASAGEVVYQRIVRIAVHPAMQNQGIGSRLLAEINKRFECDIIGSSFAANQRLLNFWIAAGFMPVRVGHHKDKVSGDHAVLMLKPASATGQPVYLEAKRRFEQQWWFLLGREFQSLDPELVITLSQTVTPHSAVLSAADLQEIKAFAYEQRSLECSQFLLWGWLLNQIQKDGFEKLSVRDKTLCVMKILQARDWDDISRKLGFTGRAHGLKALRHAVRAVMELALP